MAHDKDRLTIFHEAQGLGHVAVTNDNVLVVRLPAGAQLSHLWIHRNGEWGIDDVAVLADAPLAGLEVRGRLEEFLELAEDFPGHDSCPRSESRKRLYPDIC